MTSGPFHCFELEYVLFHWYEFFTELDSALNYYKIVEIFIDIRKTSSQVNSMSQYLRLNIPTRATLHTFFYTIASNFSDSMEISRN